MRAPLFAWSLTPALADLFGAEAADAVQTKGEDDAVFFAEADVETRKLDRRGAAVPGMSERHGGTDQRAVASSRSLLKIEEERCAAKEPAIAIPQKHRRTPLRTAHCPRLKATRIGKTREARIQLDRARPKVVESVRRPCPLVSISVLKSANRFRRGR